MYWTPENEGEVGREGDSACIYVQYSIVPVRLAQAVIQESTTHV